MNSDWYITNGGDGFESAIDPENPNIVYAQWQRGNLNRHDRKTGENTNIKPQPEFGEKTERFNWDAPILVSPHNPKRLYFASQRVWKSDDRGDSWQTISKDLTNNIERHKKIARITFPLWLYVAISGVIVYLMISPYYI